MKKILVLLIGVVFILGCDDEPDRTSSPIDLNSCFSPEFGTTEEEQFFYDIKKGELFINKMGNITSQNVGYAIQDGSNVVFVYRHFLENNFNIDDDELELRILFEIDADLNAFEISGIQEFENSKCIYSECGIALQTISGVIIGTKNSDSNWSIDANLKVQKFSQEKVIVINETFRM
ncbi:MAG: hypothetical protein ACI9P5_002579 [Saprospiraceae bacterium]|jgi:hypothetical protein